MNNTKKYIIIAGVPRSGKSTVSQLIAREFGYQHINMDSILAGIEKVFPEANIDTDAPGDPVTNLKYLSSKTAPFIRAMMDSGEYDECGYGVVIDVYQLLPSDYAAYIGGERCGIYYLLSSDTTPEERFELLKMYDTPRDYTYCRSDDENRAACAAITEVSRYMREECISFGLPFYETSHRREAAFDELLSKLRNTGGDSGAR